MTKIAILGTGYVGMRMAVLLAQKYQLVPLYTNRAQTPTKAA